MFKTCLQLNFESVHRGNVQVLIFCWGLSLLVKIDGVTFEVSMKIHPQNITKKKSQRKFTQPPHK